MRAVRTLAEAAAEAVEAVTASVMRLLAINAARPIQFRLSLRAEDLCSAANALLPIALIPELLCFRANIFAQSAV